MWDAADPSFTPIIDESYRVVGHLGWISGLQICVPIFTGQPDSPSALVLEKARLGEERERILWKYDHPIQPFPFPVQRARDPWEPSYIASLRKGPLKDGSEEQRHQNNINYYLAGGGEALVGCEFAKDLMAGRRYESFLMNDYRCLALVRPDGYLQGVLRVEKITHQTREQKELKELLEFVDLALTAWMIIDIFTIPVVLFRAGAVVARTAIRAIKVVLDEAAKAALKAAEREAKDVLDLAMQSARRELVGAMSGPEEAEAKTALEKFWHDGNVRPSKQLSENQVKKLNRKIAKRMDELGIPKKSQGAGQRITPPRGEKSPPGTGKKRPYGDENGKAFNETGNTRGANVRDVDMDRWGGIEGGISVHGNVFERWEGFDLWNDPTTTVEDRIDAVIAHEWSEFNGLSHLETVELVPETKLAIRPRARELLREMVPKGNSEMVRTEFTKTEWKAIVDAGKATASFEEKKAAVAAAAAKAK